MMSKKRKKKPRHPDPLATHYYSDRPVSTAESGMDLEDVDLDMFSGHTPKQNSVKSVVSSVVSSTTSIESNNMALADWKAQSRKRTWVTSLVPEENVYETLPAPYEFCDLTDEISQSLMALDQVIDQYDPYRLSTHNNNIGELKSQPPAYQEDDKDSNDSRNEEIRKSIEALDSVLDAYDDDASLENSDSTKRSSQVSMRSQAQKSPQSGLLRHPPRGKAEDDLPPPPPELLHDNGRPHSIHSTSGAELYARSSKRNSRAPPQVPKRNPETRLSSGSSESQELDVSRFALQDVSGLDSGYGTEQDYPHKQTYPGGYGDGYYAHTNGDVAYHGQNPLGGAPPPAPPIPPGGGIPPPLPPGGGRNSIDGGHTMPAYLSQTQQQYQYKDTNGLESIVPPPPPGFDMGANVSAQGEELYETKLPPRLDTMPPQTIESHYGAQLPHPGMDNGYPSPHELYETTLPRPMGIAYVEQRAPPPVVRRSSSSSSGSNKNSYSSGSTRDTSIGPEYSLNTPVPAPSMASPDSEFPPPPPPQFFNNMPSAPSSAPGSGPGSPVRPPPPTLPKPKGKTSQPPTPPLNGMPPPPAPMLPNTLPRANHNHVNAPPTPPPLSTLPRGPTSQTDASALAQQLANVTLRSSSPEDKPSKSSSNNAHSDLISQIHIGVALRKSPAGKKIRGSDEIGPRVDDSCEAFSETASVTSSGSGEDYSGSSTGSRPPPPTLPKPNKPSPIHTNTMPSGGSQTNNSTPAPDDFDAYDGEDAGIYEKIVDVSQLEGYQDIPDDCPAWKRAMIERKNKQLEEQIRREYQDRKAEEDKWRGVPDWKKNLIKEKEKKRGDELQAPQEEEQRRRMEEEAKLACMPEWKRNLVLKKRGDM